MQVDVREEKIRELKVVAETSRENEAKQAAIASQLRAQLVHFEAHAGSIEGDVTVFNTSLVSHVTGCGVLWQVLRAEVRWRLQRCNDKRANSKTRS